MSGLLEKMWRRPDRAASKSQTPARAQRRRRPNAGEHSKHARRYATLRLNGDVTLALAVPFWAQTTKQFPATVKAKRRAAARRAASSRRANRP